MNITIARTLTTLRTAAWRVLARLPLLLWVMPFLLAGIATAGGVTMWIVAIDPDGALGFWAIPIFLCLMPVFVYLGGLLAYALMIFVVVRVFSRAQVERWRARMGGRESFDLDRWYGRPFRRLSEYFDRQLR